jgi:2-iminobutanoate/2-iminopropanoate deaminase
VHHAKCRSTRNEIIKSTVLGKAPPIFSHGVKAGNTLYLAGQMGIDPKTDKLAKGGIKEETKQALRNMKEVLR